MVSGKKNVDYDMKHHPMGDLLRPKAAKKRSVRIWATSNASPHIRHARKEKRSPMPDDPENLLAKPINEMWDTLEPLDRRIYIAQRGAPLKGNNLPHKWPKLVNMLVKEKYFTREQFNGWGGVPALTERYEAVRLWMRTLFDAPEEPMDECDFDIRYSEDFSVYDLEHSGTETISVRYIPADDDQMDSTSHGVEDVEDMEGFRQSDDDYVADDMGYESAGGMTDMSELGGNDLDAMHRDDIANMIKDYFDVGQDDQGVTQPETAEIYLSDKLSLRASPIAELEPKADNEQSPLDVAGLKGMVQYQLQVWVLHNLS